ncbi:conserved hypothetical protein [[Clostridium] ultunense Esp]|nr:conserved hypothetical protein [[Clostridium] ultunense Esp]
MTLATVVILLITVALIEAVTYYVSIGLQMEDAKTNDAQKVKFISENMDEVIVNMNRFMDSITQDSEIQALLDRMNRASDAYGLEKELNRLILYKTAFSSDRFKYLLLFDLDELRSKLDFNVSEGFTELNSAQMQLDRDRYDLVSGRITWRIEDGTIYVDRAIRQRGSFKMLGYVTLVLEDHYLEQRIQSEAYRYTYIFGPKGEILSQSKPGAGFDTDALLHLASVTPDGVPVIMNDPKNGRMLFTTYQSEYAKWRVVSLVSMHKIAKGTVLIGKWILAIGIVGLFIGILIIWSISKPLFLPLYQLKKVMEQVEREDFQSRVDIRRSDEFGRLGRSFNQMMDKINFLISDVYKKELATKQAEYNSLIAQINPHFLYNTLETIRWLAEYGETSKIGMVAISLSKLLKASISQTNDFIPVRTELAYIEAYLTIQKARFESIAVHIQVDENVLNLYMPKLLMQPIIENAFIHGLEDKVEGGVLIVSGYRTEEVVKFQFIDNGKGIDPERIAELFRSEVSLEEKGKGIGSGLRNVHQRIRMLFGDGYGLTVTGSPDLGTIVEMSLPVITSDREAAGFVTGGL